jgi:hypothetical protein
MRKLMLFFATTIWLRILLLVNIGKALYVSEVKVI